jgi:tetratricopeptide (TPR) repeat protein
MHKWSRHGLILCLAVTAAWAQKSRPSDPTKENAEARSILGVANPYFTQASEALRTGNYQEGIRLTKEGLERPSSKHDRAMALSNLCAAYAATRQPDLAIAACTESLALLDSNWHAYSNRSYAYYLKAEYAKADTDLQTAIAINPEARQVAAIRGMINERTLRPSITVEEH